MEWQALWTLVGLGLPLQWQSLTVVQLWIKLFYFCKRNWESEITEQDMELQFPKSSRFFRIAENSTKGNYDSQQIN